MKNYMKVNCLPRRYYVIVKTRKKKIYLVFSIMTSGIQIPLIIKITLRIAFSTCGPT